MKKQPTRIIIAIGTTISGHDNYIAGRSKRWSRSQYIPRYTTDPVYAVEFDTIEDAESYIEELFNPHNRFFRAVTIQIPDIPDTRDAYLKYDRQKKKETQQPASPGISKKALTDKLVTLIACMIIIGCSKSQVPPPKQPGDVYQLIAAHYTPDTLFIKNYILWQDTVFRIEEKRKIDTIRPRWYLMCATEKYPVRLECWYYTRNGIKNN